MNRPSLNDIPALARAEIDRRLTAIEREHSVHIILAVESGSRAWGFASPDSDFDARFIYVRPLDRYLTLTEGRDVIETPIEEEMDVNGWDIRKALRLALSHNPVLIEWLQSTVIYREAADADLLRQFALAHHSRRALIRHYFGLLNSSWQRELSEMRAEVKLKRYFYAIRPAAALTWLERRPHETPPMNLSDLLAGVTLPAPLVEDIAVLRALKSVTHEIGLGRRREAIDAFAQDRMRWGQTMLATLPADDHADTADQADALFRRLIGAP